MKMNLVSMYGIKTITFYSMSQYVYTWKLVNTWNAYFINHSDRTNSFCIRKSFGHKPIFEYKWVPNRFLRLTWDETITLRQTFLWTSLTFFIKLQQPILPNLSHFNNNLFCGINRFHVYRILILSLWTWCVSLGYIPVITL